MTSVYFITWGCSANQADTEQMKGLLQEAKFEVIESLDDADIVILNSCSVKSPSEIAFFKKLKEVKAEHPYKIIIIAGCIAQTAPDKLKKYTLIGTKQIHNIVEIVEEALNDNIVKALETGEMPPLNLPKVRKNPIIEIIPISRGCLGACTFCKTKAARGNLISYPIEDIVNEAKKAVSEEVKEIWITSQDTGCYGFDLDTNLAKLLHELVKIPGRFKIRIGMMNPDHLLKFKDEFFDVFADKKIFKFLHLPVQSGSDKVLQTMNRKYIVKDFLGLVNEIKEKFPRINFATDIITGFPGETEEEHWETLNLIRNIHPDIVNISKFWPRPKTPAAKMKQLPTEVVKLRSKVIRDICVNIFRMRNERWLDWEGEIIIDEKGKNAGQWIGRNKSYKPVIVEGNYKLGDIIKIKVVKITSWDLRGEVIS
jgi:threonylcarbamoyladenosine tRNA methylthiotransferase CDKAL1